MCAPMFPSDHIPNPSEASEKLRALIEAITAQHSLVVRIHEGARSHDFAGHDAVGRIDRARQAVERAWDAYQLADVSLLTGEPYRFSLSSMTLSAAMKSAVVRNDAKPPVRSPLMRCVDAVSAADMAPPATNYAALEAGFHPSV